MMFMFSSLRNCQTIIQSNSTILFATSTSFQFLHSLAILDIVSHYSRVYTASHYSLMWIFLMTMFKALYVSSYHSYIFFGECLKYVAHLKKLGCLLIVSICFYINWICVLYQIIFFQSVGSLFIFFHFISCTYLFLYSFLWSLNSFLNKPNRL